MSSRLCIVLGERSTCGVMLQLIAEPTPKREFSEREKATKGGIFPCNSTRSSRLRPSPSRARPLLHSLRRPAPPTRARNKTLSRPHRRPIRQTRRLLARLRLRRARRLRRRRSGLRGREHRQVRLECAGCALPIPTPSRVSSRHRAPCRRPIHPRATSRTPRPRPLHKQSGRRKSELHAARRSARSPGLLHSKLV